MARSSELPSSRAASWTSFGSTTITDYGWPNSAFTCLSRRRVAPSAGDRRSGLLPASGAVGLLFSVILLSGVQPINGGEAGPAFLPETRHDFGVVRQGAEVMHGFLLQNRRETPLAIERLALIPRRVLRRWRPASSITSPWWSRPGFHLDGTGSWCTWKRTTRHAPG